MAHRSDFEAALARLDAIASDRPCPVCKRSDARRARWWRVVGVVGTVVMWTVFGMLGAAVFAFLALLVVFASMDFSHFG